MLGCIYIYTHVHAHTCMYATSFPSEIGVGVNEMQGQKSEMLQSLNKPQTLILVVTNTVSTEPVVVNLSFSQQHLLAYFYQASF